MARKRMISPEMFTSESVAALPIPTRWTWAGVLCYLDDCGIGKNNPALIKAAIWPLDDTYTSRKVAADVTRLVSMHMLCAYSCCGTKFIHAPSWDTWQKISHATPTKFCVCPVHAPDASRIHRRYSGETPDLFGSDTGATPRNVIEVNSIERNVSGDASEQSPSGSLAIAEARAVLRRGRSA